MAAPFRREDGMGRAESKDEGVQPEVAVESNIRLSQGRQSLEGDTEGL